MTFADLRRELAARGIRGRLAARIEAELADHLACDPDANLGEPAEIAERFAAELCVGRTRRASVWTFASLALCAALIAVAGAQRGTGGDPWAGLAMLGCGQVAFVAGSLALLRGLRGRAAGDLRVTQRRAGVALAAGAGVAAGIAAEGHLLAFACAAAALAALAAAGLATRDAVRLTPAAESRGLSADLGPHSTLILAALGAIAVGGIVFQGVVFEGSGWEGIVRGALEAGGLALGVASLGRLLRLRA
jgi:hypothetical protein